MRGSAAYKSYYEDKEDTIRVMTYEEWEEVRETAERMMKRKQNKARKRMELYYKQQRIFGLYVCTIAVVFILMGYITNITTLMVLGDVFALSGLYTMFTRRMLLVNSYFIEKRKVK